MNSRKLSVVVASPSEYERLVVEIETVNVRHRLVECSSTRSSGLERLPLTLTLSRTRATIAASLPENG